MICNFKRTSNYIRPITADPGIDGVTIDIDEGTMEKAWDVGLYAPEEGWTAEDLEYPLWIAQKVINLLGDYLGVSYPLSKMDLVIVPDLSNEAVAQWGLSTFK